jgi:non-ribosomal peptide synthetase component E (peptide arylation enzyme)
MRVTPRKAAMADTATTHKASQEANTWVSAQSSIIWSVVTTKAATPAAKSNVDKVFAEVAGAGAWPKTDFETVAFILYSLLTGFVALKIRSHPTLGLNLRVTTSIVQLYIHDVYHSHW